MEKYIERYKKAKQDLSKPINRTLVKYSTLQYYEKEIGILTKDSKTIYSPIKNIRDILNKRSRKNIFI